MHKDSVSLDSLWVRIHVLQRLLDSTAAAVRALVTTQIRDSGNGISQGPRKFALSTISPSATNGWWLTTTGGVATWSALPTSSGTVTSISVNAPLSSSPTPITTTGTIGINQASGSGDGYLSSTDWTAFNGKASTTSIADSLARARAWRKQFSVDAYGAISDSGTRSYFNGLSGGSWWAAPWSYATVTILNEPAMLDAISITHSYDSSLANVMQGFRRADVTHRYSVRDSLPAGARVYIYYSPKSDNTAFNGTGLQILSVLYMDANGTTSYIIGEPVQVPLIPAGSGVSSIVQSHRGVRNGHSVRATLHFTEKLPGITY